MTLPPDLLQFAEEFQKTHGLSSRSEVMVQALQLLQEQELREAYQAASAEWDQSEDRTLWETASEDGLEHLKW